MKWRNAWRAPWARLALKILGGVILLLLVAVLAGFLTFRGSMPRLEGERTLACLGGRVQVDRDGLGVPDITAVDRRDAAVALGYVHAQDRFFQMDLMRRSSAGELAALLGPALLDTDRNVRRHRFRTRGREAFTALPSGDRALLEAYTAGVNAGLVDLTSRPWEYWLLRQEPEPWRPEDSLLALYAMFLDLSFSTVKDEANLARIAHAAPDELEPYLLPRGNSWEAPLQEGHAAREAVPDSTVIDVRKWTFSGRSYEGFKAYQDSMLRQDTAGSNNWAVAGGLTAHGGALLANDMHLGLSLPNTWYRACLSWADGGRDHSVVGVTLPGAPLMVVGSNGRLAWGFTNSYGDWSDLVILETDPADSTRYRTPDGWRHTEAISEVIHIKGQAADTLTFEETVWGPLWGNHPDGRRWALRWTPHDVRTVNLNLRLLETATGVDEALAVAGRVGIPQQNLVCADAEGRIAWTIAGFIPRRVGWDGRLPVSWADGRCRWDGFLPASGQPRVVDPPEGRLWTANSRVAAGRDLQLIGDGGYGVGARARQIRDDLRALDRPDEGDMLQVQLDDRALYLAEWRDLLLPALERHAAEADSTVALFAEIVRDRWSGRAEPASVAYRLVRTFMYHAIERVYKILGANVYAKYPDFREYYFPHGHAVAMAVLKERPAHLLSPQFEDWDQFMIEIVYSVAAKCEWEGLELEDWTWGRRNRLDMAHPFTRLAPWLSRWLAAPARELPGGGFMPRVQGPGHGASQRLVVSPGREEQAIFHMPGGQCGHPLSPYFLAGHQDWVEGKATPLLPGASRHHLILGPKGN